MDIITLTLPPIGTNCYIVGDEKTAAVIDPASCGDKIYDAAKNAGLDIKAILLTHGHFDHIGAVDELVRLTGADVYIHAFDAVMLSDGYLNASRIFFGKDTVQNSKFKTVSNGDLINIGSLEFKVVHTPGHTAGSVCYFCGDAVFTGDTLFCGGYGRTDLPGGNFGDLMRSLDHLKEKTKGKTIYPGH